MAEGCGAVTYSVEFVGDLHQLLVHLDPDVLALKEEETTTSLIWEGQRWRIRMTMRESTEVFLLHSRRGSVGKSLEVVFTHCFLHLPEHIFISTKISTNTDY